MRLEIQEHRPIEDDGGRGNNGAGAGHEGGVVEGTGGDGAC